MVLIWWKSGGKYAEGTLQSEYLDPMALLESCYPNVTFVYMTSPLEHADDANCKAANEQIRDYCNDNNKVLYDFGGIKSYGPDGNHFEFTSDNCRY